VSDATSELHELIKLRPEISPLPFDSRALKARIEQTNAARPAGGRTDDDQRLFWGLMACFCSRRLLDCAEDADAASFDAFMTQVASNKQSKLCVHCCCSATHRR
jgi:hypothetical protein